MSGRTLYVWDFHGTLEEGTFEQTIHVTNTILKKYGHAVYDKEEALLMFGKHWILWFKNKATNAGLEEIQKMYNEGQEWSWSNIKPYVKPRKHSSQVLKKIQESGDANIVVSNCLIKKLHTFTKHTGLEEYFDYFIGNDDIHPEKERVEDYKYRKVKEYLGNNSFNKIVCVGDQETDVLLGVKLKKLRPTTTYRVYNGEKPRTIADFLINDLRKIL